MMEKRCYRGVHFLRVRGSAVERAQAHALLLKTEFQQGAIPVLSRRNEMLIRQSPSLAGKPLRQALSAKLYKKLLIPLMHRHTDPRHRAEQAVMAEVTGIAPEDFAEAPLQPDAVMLLSRASMMKYFIKDLPSIDFPMNALPGCTSAVVAPDWTRSGRLLACRNLDYPIVGPWERNVTVLFHEPTERGQIPHVALTTAGVHTAGLTSINREGIALFLHAHFGKRVSIRGKAAIYIGDEIISRAKTLGEAVDIARKNRRIGNWTFVVLSAKERSALAIEMSPTRTLVREMQDGFIAHSNYFQSPGLQEEEALLSGGCFEDLVARPCRLRQLLEKNRGNLEPAHLTSALGDHFDPFTKEERVFGNTISVVTTVQSAVFDPEARRLWISSRPESPTGLGDFLQVDLDRFWDGDPAQEPEVLPGNRPAQPRLVEAISHYRQAYCTWHMSAEAENRAEKTLLSLRRAVSSYPHDGNLWVQTGIIAFQSRRFQEAYSCFTRARSHNLSAHTHQVCNLYIARCLDLMGKRSRALTLYRRHAEAREPKLRKALKRGLRRPYRRKQISSIMSDLQFPDSFAY